MNWPSIIILTLVATAFIAVIANGIRKKKKGISSCNCGGSCGACPMDCPSKKS